MVFSNRHSTEYGYDGLGSIVALTNHQGKVKEQYRYDVYGIPVVGKLKDNPDGFTGKRFDPESGLYHFHFRKYDPSIGVWTSEDPIRVAGGINLYGYVRNDPVNLIDVYGLFNLGKVVGGAASMVGGAISVAAGSALCVVGAAELATIASGNVAGPFIGIHTMGVGGTLVGAGIATGKIGYDMLIEGWKEEEEEEEVIDKE